MSVTLAWELPAQSGAVISSQRKQTYIPLGGNGFQSPFAAYSLRSIGIQGVAATGDAAIAVTMDPRFCSLVCWVQGTIETSVSGQDEWIKLTVESDTTAVATVSADVKQSQIGSSDYQMIWQPPPVILPGGDDGSIIRAQFEDLGTAYNYYIDAFILLFNIRARELVPYETLLGARGGGGMAWANLNANPS